PLLLSPHFPSYSIFLLILICLLLILSFFFFKDTAPSQIYTLSLHDALPISLPVGPTTRIIPCWWRRKWRTSSSAAADIPISSRADRKSTRLNSSHVEISYAVFCLKKKKRKNHRRRTQHGRNNHKPLRIIDTQ